MNSAEAYFGLPSDVFFCSKFNISNQHPISADEYKHKDNSDKETVSFDSNRVCSACHYK